MQVFRSVFSLGREFRESIVITGLKGRLKTEEIEQIDILVMIEIAAFTAVRDRTGAVAGEAPAEQLVILDRREAIAVNTNDLVYSYGNCASCTANQLRLCPPGPLAR